jgi:D-alanine-D-alanine ligase
MRRLEAPAARLAVGACETESNHLPASRATSAGPNAYISTRIVKKLRVGVIYGGRSGEHEVSVASAASIISHLPRERYEPIAIRIEKDGRWTLPDKPPTAISVGEVIERGRLTTTRQARPGRTALMVTHPGEETVLTIERRNADLAPSEDGGAAIVTGLSLDVVFPALHGPYGEDGTVQGLLELAGVPYVGAGVLGSAVGMDKAVMKTLFAAHKLPIVKHVLLLARDWARDPDGALARIQQTLRWPLFVKPANMGSSVGISKVETPDELGTAIDTAAEFDRKIVIEAAVPQAREIECAVLGNDEPEASVPGEVVPTREFYDYEAKYLDDSSQLLIPAPLTDTQASEVRRLTIAAFRAVDGAGMARVDFLMDRRRGKLYLNEVNTIPGFTTISMYPKLWEATGLPYATLIDRLITLAIERRAENQQLRTSAT